MSGHSKWTQIKRQKGVADIKRGEIFTKIANAITMAVKQGGGVTDPNNNFRLRLAIDKARAVNMPKENIDRAIERARGQKGGEMEEVLYEGFGPSKIALIIEAVTDNKLRTNAQVKSIFEKEGAILGQPGATSYLFKNSGRITAKMGNFSSDEFFLMAAESGAEDIEEKEDEVFIYTQNKDLTKVKDSLLQKGIVITKAELVWRPTTATIIENEEKTQKIIDFIGKLDALDDVQKVYSNLKH